MSEYNQQRQHVRFQANLAIRVRTLGSARAASETGRMVDVSEGGLCFLGAYYLPPGTQVRIEFTDCMLLGEVRHCRLQEYASRTQFVTGVQVRSVEAGQGTWDALTQK